MVVILLSQILASPLPTEPFCKSNLLSDGGSPEAKHPVLHGSLPLPHAIHKEGRCTDLICYKSGEWPWREATALPSLPHRILGKRRNNMFLGPDIGQDLNKHPVK